MHAGTGCVLLLSPTTGYSDINLGTLNQPDLTPHLTVSGDVSQAVSTAEDVFHFLIHQRGDGNVIRWRTGSPGCRRIISCRSKARTARSGAANMVGRSLTASGQGSRPCGSTGH